MGWYCGYRIGWIFVIDTPKTLIGNMRQTLQVSDDSLDMASRDEVRKQSADLQQQILQINGRMIENDLVITLGEVLFEKNKTALKRGAASHLQKIIYFIEQHPDFKIVIKGHTDNLGSNLFNLEFSENRAGTIKSFLIKEGIPSGRLTSIGHGETYPVAGNGSSSGRQLNQRVEIVIKEFSLKKFS